MGELDIPELLIRLNEWTGVSVVLEDPLLRREIVAAYHAIETLQANVKTLSDMNINQAKTITEYDAREKLDAEVISAQQARVKELDALNLMHLPNVELLHKMLTQRPYPSGADWQFIEAWAEQFIRLNDPSNRGSDDDD